MRQILLLIFVFFASQWLFRKLRRANARAQTATQGTRADTGGASGASARSGNGASGAPQLPDPLVRCAECGVHTPRSETLVVAGQRFCCSDHAHRHAARATGRDAR
ncbi:MULTISPECIES: PP0621 family protein [unclassified Caballeronia]|uniref:PP0621 family protein n=1 Tax=unclassified Caballeronia TaxID=2646786 RepID=UPI00286419B1|nr:MULTISPECIES: PP0621 family protein [unclassified Caballeronia]MDR5751686.1 PP0621 family protein [Caballeronia sp. LZ024]MDR5844174.1 PP0621 family protein [Caballeronia sp. LZ031]